MLVVYGNNYILLFIYGGPSVIITGTIEQYTPNFDRWDNSLLKRWPHYYVRLFLITNSMRSYSERCKFLDSVGENPRCILIGYYCIITIRLAIVTPLTNPSEKYTKCIISTVGYLISDLRCDSYVIKGSKHIQDVTVADK